MALKLPVRLLRFDSKVSEGEIFGQRFQRSDPCYQGTIKIFHWLFEVVERRKEIVLCSSSLLYLWDATKMAAVLSQK